ncbi:hypothetical protein M0R45_021197 [Rubus argutus]|uniref:Stress-response A/B barrel domain-containing protein n=1 Tax=Rubus argutus TaxID=59490 RepID=A0AAW1XDR6_RUBAR
MDEAKGVVKHVVLTKFKEGVSESEIEQVIKGFANLVNLIDPMHKYIIPNSQFMQWTNTENIRIKYMGFTHIFQSTFKSTEDVVEYAAHPAHVDFANLFLPCVDKFLAFDYKPTTVRVCI